MTDIITKYNSIQGLTVLTLEQQQELNSIPDWLYQIPSFEKFVFTDPVERHKVFLMLKNRKPSGISEHHYYYVATHILSGIESKKVLLDYCLNFFKTESRIEFFIQQMMLNRDFHTISDKELAQALLELPTNGLFLSGTEKYLFYIGMNKNNKVEKVEVAPEISSYYAKNLMGFSFSEYVKYNVHDVCDMYNQLGSYYADKSLREALSLRIDYANQPDIMRLLEVLKKKYREGYVDTILKTIIDYDRLSEEDRIKATLIYGIKSGS